MLEDWRERPSLSENFGSMFSVVTELLLLVLTSVFLLVKGASHAKFVSCSVQTRLHSMLLPQLGQRLIHQARGFVVPVRVGGRGVVFLSRGRSLLLVFFFEKPVQLQTLQDVDVEAVQTVLGRLRDRLARLSLLHLPFLFLTATGLRPAGILVRSGGLSGDLVQNDAGIVDDFHAGATGLAPATVQNFGYRAPLLA